MIAAPRSLNCVLTGNRQRSARFRAAEAATSPEQAKTGNRKPKPESGHQDRRRLPGDREPAKPDERIEPQPSRLAAQSLFLSRKHDVQTAFVSETGPPHSIFSFG